MSLHSHFTRLNSFLDTLARQSPKDRRDAVANEVIEQTACENPDSAKVYLSQLEYLADYAKWRDASAPFNLGRTPNGPDIEAIRACAN